VPEWQGWVVLGAVVVGFATLAWWLFGSRIEGETPRHVTNEATARLRGRIAALMLVSATALMIGARWDELWHRMYGGFGDDFLWPPHLLIYAALGLNGVFAGVGLAWALQGSGGIRERFRAEPLMGLVGLLSAYQMASIPSDALWHEIIGPDLTAWSLPHALLTLTSNLATVGAAGLALSTAPRRAWRWLGKGGLRGGELVALALFVAANLFLLQFVGTEWEWGRGSPGRPEWMYLAAMLAAGAAVSHLALHATRIVGAATAIAVASLALQLVGNAVMRLSLPPGPQLIGHLLLLAPAIALDLWYLRRGPGALLDGALLYAAVFCAAALAYLAVERMAAVVVLALVVAPPVAWLAARFGGWLSQPCLYFPTRVQMAE
jgi:hypothetical protein